MLLLLLTSSSSVHILFYIVAVAATLHQVDALATAGVKARSFVFLPSAEQRNNNNRPKLVIISGCSGTGKSTFGMSVALDQGILKCISTDTVRAVMRSFITQEISPALHRSSYSQVSPGDDPVRNWRETCTVLEASVQGLVEDALHRGVGLVLEGVSIVPSEKLIKKWEAGGGVACGCLLTISDESVHKSLLQKRGFFSGDGQKEKDSLKLEYFDRVRRIQDEMISLAEDAQWLLIEQKIDPDPLEIIASKLSGSEECESGSIESRNEMTEMLSTRYNAIETYDDIGDSPVSVSS